MKIFFDHITGQLTHHDLIYSLTLAEFEPDEYDYAFDNGWIPLPWYYIKMNKLTWLNARSSRIILDKFTFSKKQKYKLKAEVTFKVVNKIDEETKKQQGDIYRKYAKYKGYDEEDFFAFREDPIDWKTFLYYQNDKLIAFTEFYDFGKHLFTGSFAWDYEDYKLGVGTFATLSEIKWAIDNCYEKYYLSYAYEKSSLYKAKYDGFEFWTGRKWLTDKDTYIKLCNNDSQINTLENLNDYQEEYFKILKHCNEGV